MEMIAFFTATFSLFPHGYKTIMRIALPLSDVGFIYTAFNPFTCPSSYLDQAFSPY
jgi:hypothetical protein